MTDKQKVRMKDGQTDRKTGVSRRTDKQIDDLRNEQTDRHEQSQIWTDRQKCLSGKRAVRQIGELTVRGKYRQRDK